MRNLGFLACLAIATILSSCGVFNNSAKYDFSDGYYKIKLDGSLPTRVYAENREDSIVIYLLRRSGKNYVINTSSRRNIILPEFKDDSLFQKSVFARSGFDLDFLTIPIKYRPPSEGFPRQMISNLNGAAYIGYRSDYYIIRYKKFVIEKFKRNISHYGLSIGTFSGLGSTFMNPWVTRNTIAIEYDGLIWLKGFSFNIGIENYTLGLTLGWDHLLDENRKNWIYEGKPWIGLGFGLNLN
jgi:hypothetical protein